MNDGLRARARGAERVHVSHHVVPPPALLLRRALEVDLRDACRHLSQLLVWRSKETESQLKHSYHSVRSEILRYSN